MRVFPLVVLLIFAAAVHGLCEELQLPAHNISITPPEGWKSMEEAKKQPGVVAAFGNADRTKLVMVIIDEKNKVENPEMSEKFVREFEAGVASSGGSKRKWGRFVEVSGIKGYERLGELKVNGRDLTVWSRVVLGDGKHHTVDGMRVGGDASEDPEIRQAVESFRFLKTPAKIAAANTGSAAYRAGYARGQATMWLLAAGGAIFGIGAALRKKSPPKGPPPLSPK